MKKQIKTTAADQQPKYPIYDNGTLYPSFPMGNTKMGPILYFSTLPGNSILTAKGRPLTNIVGTCGKYCESCKKACYAVRTAIYRQNSCLRSWARNTVILRNDPEKLKRAIKEICIKMVAKYFRFHVSGEFESVEQIKLYCDICRDSPEVTFYVYTKVFDLFAEYILIYGALPVNFVVNLSIWYDNLERFYCEFSKSHTPGELETVKKHFSRFGLFIYDDGAADLRNIKHCPAVDENGHETGLTCAQCRRCMKAGTVTAVYAH